MSIFDQIGSNPALKEFGAKLGFGKQQSDKNAEDDLAASRAAYEALQPPKLTKEQPDFATVTDQNPSEMGTISVNPADREAQTDQLAALSNLAKNGGRNAASDYNLARVQGNELANAKGQRDAVMANANARGMGGSGAELVAQLSGNQAAQSNANMQDMGELANESNTAMNAGMGAANIGAGMESQDFNQQASKAQAQDAINRFNSSNRTANSQYNTGIANDAQKYNTGLEQTGYQNTFQKQAGIAGANMAGVNYNQAQSNIGAQQAGNLLGGATKLGAAAMTARGGKIEAPEVVPGDSTLNDIVPIKASGGEVMLPKTLAKSGSPQQIVNFVKNPPKVHLGGQDKEAMLSALQNIRRRRGGM